MGGERGVRRLRIQDVMRGSEVNVVLSWIDSRATSMLHTIENRLLHS